MSTNRAPASPFVARVRAALLLELLERRWRAGLPSAAITTWDRRRVRFVEPIQTKAKAQR